MVINNTTVQQLFNDLTTLLLQDWMGIREREYVFVHKVAM